MYMCMYVNISELEAYMAVHRLYSIGWLSSRKKEADCHAQSAVRVLFNFHFFEKMEVEE